MESGMKVFVLIKDETDYNGEREVFGVYPAYDAAKAVGDWEAEKARDWVNTMREGGENVGDWVPSFYIEETEFYNGV
jgi:hypothetical protein